MLWVYSNHNNCLYINCDIYMKKINKNSWGYYIHQKCGGRAFEIIKEVKCGDIAHSNNALQENYTPIEWQKMNCDNCGECIMEGHLLKWENVIKY